ncbi:hypothetical protein HAX54_000699 [Datura stramonium]|uniref:Uncharacterized protein n=1 Tax=Datura stramonium TaxID=4076 RepID=A0ABS8T2C5_DATST|nr:hypothetical protein [Datura stramonium]
MASRGESFPAVDAEKELNPQNNKEFQVDSVSSQVASSIEKEAKEKLEKMKKDKDRKDAIQNFKTAMIISGVVVAVSGCLLKAFYDSGVYRSNDILSFLLLISSPCPPLLLLPLPFSSSLTSPPNLRNRKSTLSTPKISPSLSKNSSFSSREALKTTLELWVYVMYPGNLLSYDPESREFKDLDIQGRSESFFLCKYVESLVLLDGSNGATTDPSIASESEEATELQPELG